MRAVERLPDRAAALDAAHFGDQEGGRKRLAFDELLLLQLGLLRRRARRRESARAEALVPPGELTARWLEHSLPFTPTGDQRSAMDAIDAELCGERPMQALLPGELVQAALLTGSTPAARRTDLLGKLATGELKLLVGTHAVIEDPV